MKKTLILLSLFAFFGVIKAQKVETYYLHYSISKNKKIIYKRIIEFDKENNLYHVKDYYPTGQIQMDAFYSLFDKNIKEELQCNYYSNTKQGKYSSWYRNGQLEYTGNYKNGLRNGLCSGFYKNGQKEMEQNWLNGQLHGNVKYWTEKGDLKYDLTLNHGLNQNPINVNYKYITYLSKGYVDSKLKKWPLIIYLHGGSSRGTDMIKLYCCGIPDQIWRKREFPFIIVAPQCPTHKRWSTDNWFLNFYEEIAAKYRVDTNRVYLTGVSLGGAGTWYLAIKYPEKFAAIAPMSGFTHHIDYIMKNANNLIDIPIWAFHGKIDKVVEFNDTKWMVDKLNEKNKDLKFTLEPDVGHWMDWEVYPKQELYEWFLKHVKQTQNKIK